MKKILCVFLSLICGVSLMACGDDFYSNSKKYDKEYFNDLITAVESGDEGNIRALFARDLQENSDDLDTGIREILSLYQGKISSSESKGAETKSLNNGYKHIYSTYEVITDKGSYCISYLYQAGGKEDERGFRHIGMCKSENYLDEDVMIGFPQCEGAYAYCSDEAKDRINKKLEEAGFDFEGYKKARG